MVAYLAEMMAKLPGEDVPVGPPGSRDPSPRSEERNSALSPRAPGQALSVSSERRNPAVLELQNRVNEIATQKTEVTRTLDAAKVEIVRRDEEIERLNHREVELESRLEERSAQVQLLEQTLTANQADAAQKHAASGLSRCGGRRAEY